MQKRTLCIHKDKALLLQHFFGTRTTVNKIILVIGGLEAVKPFETVIVIKGFTKTSMM